MWSGAGLLGRFSALSGGLIRLGKIGYALVARFRSFFRGGLDYLVKRLRQVGAFISK